MMCKLNLEQLFQCWIYIEEFSHEFIHKLISINLAMVFFMTRNYYMISLTKIHLSFRIDEIIS